MAGQAFAEGNEEMANLIEQVSEDMADTLLQQASLLASHDDSISNTGALGDYIGQGTTDATKDSMIAGKPGNETDLETKNGVCKFKGKGK